jgi:hypothetical protein
MTINKETLVYHQYSQIFNSKFRLNTFKNNLRTKVMSRTNKEKEVIELDKILTTYCKIKMSLYSIQGGQGLLINRVTFK